MWNPKSIVLPFAILGFAAFQSSTQDPSPTTDLSAQVKALETKVKSLEAYVKNQAKAAGVVSKAIDAAVAEGFTVGINFKSRETLVSAWKAAAKAQAETGIGKEEAPARGGFRRGR